MRAVGDVLYIASSMKVYPLLLAAMLNTLCVIAQDECVDGFAKLFPDGTTDYSLEFGTSLSIHENFLAVGVPNSDTLHRESGIVYLYEKRDGSWTKIASFAASNPIPDLRLGTRVKLTENYLFASGSANGGSVYVYRKPPTGWETATELTVISVEGSTSFGTAYHHPIDLSEDENTLVITDALKPHNSNPVSIGGSIFVFHKQDGTEWTNTITPFEIKAYNDVMDLGRTGTFIRGDRIYAGTPFHGPMNGGILVYYDDDGDFSSPHPAGMLMPQYGDSFWPTASMAVIDDGIFMTSAVPGEGLKINYYERPADGDWYDTFPTCVFDPDGDVQTSHNTLIQLEATPTDIFAVFKTGDAVSLAKLSKGPSGWCSPTVEIIDTRITSGFGNVIAVNENEDIVAGHVGHPWNGTVFNALNAYNKDGDNWESSVIYSTTKSTRNHTYGHALAVHDNTMFVSAPRDNSFTENGGKIYIYQQDTPVSPWAHIASIHPPGGALPGYKFGDGIATNGEYLAVGASRYDPPSLMLIYRKGAGGWSNPEFVQAIQVPTGDVEEAMYGESIAMNERWMVIGFANNRGFGNMQVAVYELAQGTWQYRQTLATDYTGIFTGVPIAGVAISGNTIVAADKVYEFNETTGEWELAAKLMHRDPQPLSFIYPQFILSSNGTNFGRSIAIQDNVIAIGSPRHDNGSVWDVGAVYVYTKAPNEKWTTRYETTKVVPNTIAASSLFGWTVGFAGTSLVIGAPTASTFAKPDPGQSSANYARGKVYLYRAEDSSWKRISMLRVYEGTTSFRDNFGVQATHANGKIVISASEEGIPTGFPSGAVYITDAPITIDPVDQLCSDSQTITLTATTPGGVWSGPGITNANAGTFSPSLAGAGTHVITYTGGVCQQSTFTNILIGPAVNAQILGRAEVLVCESYFTRTLSARPNADAKYEWYYRPDPNSSFTKMYDETRQIEIEKLGQYQVRISNSGCDRFSGIVTVKKESIQVVIDPPGEVCGTPPEGMSISATPAGGIWSGPGITNNKFSAEGLNDGSHVIWYQYTSPTGCTYNGQTTISVKRMARPGVSRSGHLCQNGVVTLKHSGFAVDGATYVWKKQDLETGVITEVGSGSTIETDSRGMYYLEVRKDYCESSTAHAVTDTFTAHLTPPETEEELCYDHNLELSFIELEGATYEWYYSPDGLTQTLLSESANALRPDKTGHYTGVVHRGVCTFTAESKYFFVHKKDSVFVPNVFTPNGDGKNDSFYVIVFNQDDGPDNGDGQDNVSYDIFNRYGRKVFSAPHNEEWTGDNVSSGVYFWQGKYNTCLGEPKVVNGYVHLIK